MAEIFDFVEFIRRNGAIVAVVCRDVRGIEREIDANVVRDNISNGTYVVHGLYVDDRGLHITGGSRRHDSNYDNILRDLHDIKRMLNLRSELDGINNQLLTLTQSSSRLNSLVPSASDINAKLAVILNKIDTLADEHRRSSTELKYGKDAILQKLNAIGVSNDEQFNALQEKFKFLFAGKTYDGTIKYPKCSIDLNKDLVYYPEDATISREQFDKHVGSQQFCGEYDDNDREIHDSEGNAIRSAVIFKFDYNEKVFKILRGHIEIVNTVRVSSEEAFNNDIANKRYSGVSAKEASEIEALNSTCEYLLAAGVGALAFPVDGVGIITGTAVKAGAEKLANPAKTMINVVKEGIGFKTDKSKVKDYRTNKLGFLESRKAGIYNQFQLTRVNRDELLANRNNADSYSIDIRLFVVNCCGSLIKHNWKDINDAGSKYSKVVRQTKKKPYSDFVVGSLAILPISSDERLFNFYCKFYLAKYTGVDISNIYAQTQTGIDSYKAYMDAFINAYFASKKSMIHVGAELLNILDDMDYTLTSSSDLLLYGQFMLRVKMCLVIQGIRAEKAEWLIHKFMHYDNTLNKYTGKLIQLRTEEMQDGIAVK